MQVAQILFVLSILVVLHEFGHYITARWFKVRVEKFYLFMDPWFSLFKKKIKDTEWGIGWLPIGGYVKLSGMIDESMDTEQLKQEPQPWEFRSKPAWQRLIIMLGGIIVNILLAWFIYTVLYITVGQKYISTEKVQENGLAFGDVGQKVGFKNGDKIIAVDGKFQNNFNRMALDILFSDEVTLEREGKTLKMQLSDEQKSEIIGKEGKNFVVFRQKEIVVDSILPNSTAAKAGLKKGDKIIAFNNKPLSFFDELGTELNLIKQDSASLTINRNNQTLNLPILVNKERKIGFFNAFNIDKEQYIITNRMSFLQAIPAAIKESWYLFDSNIKSLKLIFRPKTGAYKKVSSPIGIARQLPDEWNWEFIWNFTAMLSVVLAFMNLLPIPGLDGGHALFTIGEMVTGKKMNDKTAGYVQTVGMVILLTIMALTFGKDIYQLIVDKF